MATTLTPLRRRRYLIDILGKKSDKNGVALGLILAAVPFLLIYCSADGRGLPVRSLLFSFDSQIGTSEQEEPASCPQGMTYGLRLVEADESTEATESLEVSSSLRIRHGRRLQAIPGMDMGCVATTRIDPDDGTCLNALPYGIMHDEHPDEVWGYQKKEVSTAGGKAAAERGYDGDVPDLETLPPGSSFANWDCRMYNNKKGKEDYCADTSVTGFGKVRASAWTADGVDSFEDVWRKWLKWAPHGDYLRIATRTTVLSGDVVAHVGFNPRNFGHIIHDNLVLVAWLRSVSPPTSTFLLPDHETFRNLVGFIDPDFAASRVYWYKSNEIITVEKGSLTVSGNHPILPGKLGNTLWKYLRGWIGENHPIRYPNEERTVVYYVRGILPTEEGTTGEDGDSVAPIRASANTKHGRILDLQHERDVVATIRSAMHRHRRTEKLVFFTGSDEHGNILPYEEQLDVFRRASTIVGPHGSGLANAVWTDPFPQSCEERVKMLEFIPGKDSAQVQVLYNGYYWNMRGLPIDWHQITYAANSTTDVTYVQLPDLERALDGMWGTKN